MNTRDRLFYSQNEIYESPHWWMHKIDMVSRFVIDMNFNHLPSKLHYITTEKHERSCLIRISFGKNHSSWIINFNKRKYKSQKCYQERKVSISVWYGSLLTDVMEMKIFLVKKSIKKKMDQLFIAHLSLKISSVKLSCRFRFLKLNMNLFNTFWEESSTSFTFIFPIHAE